MTQTQAPYATVEVTMHVDGEPVDARNRFEVRDPGRVGDLVALVAEGRPEDVDRAVDAARRAGPGWAGTPLTDRIALLTAAADRIDGEIAALRVTLVRENGSTLREAEADLSRGVAVLRATLDLAAAYLQPVVHEDTVAWLSIEKAPLGVTALVVPWNSPIVLTFGKLAPALVAGNTLVVKPSPLAPIALTRCLELVAARLPRGVVNVVQGDTPVGAALTSHPAVRKVSFTGSIATGRVVLGAAAATIKNVSLELGGNDPAIVLPDADLAAVVPDLCRGAFTRAGQICFAVKRVYVHRDRLDEFADAVAAELSDYRVGHGLDERTTYGPLISAQRRREVQDLVEGARAAGGEVREYGAPGDPGTWDGGHYLLPTVVLGLADDADLITCEQFGPVLPVIAYDSEDDAVARANDSEFGLSSSVWSTDVAHAVDVARRLEAGATFINSHNLWSLSLDMPMGGVKQSGLGRERTELGLHEYVESHAIRILK